MFNAALALVAFLFGAGWTWEIALAAERGSVSSSVGRLTADPFATDAAPEAAFVLDALIRRFADVEQLHGISHEVRVALTEPGKLLALPILDSLPAGVATELHPVHDGMVDLTEAGIPVDTLSIAPAQGVWALMVGSPSEMREVPDLRIIVQVPTAERVNGSIGRYQIGEWPFENGNRPPRDIYQTPRGFVEVTPENMAMPVSDQFVFGDFLTKGQVDVWPKYVVMSPRLLDKLELTIAELEKRRPVRDVGVISGFRTPWYNAHGGSTEGRASLSRHMYGDAMDVYIDSDGDGGMDDLNGDGKVNVGDARVLAAAADAVEKAHPSLIGGIGIYAPTSAHRGFIHIDTRGYRARW